MGTCWRCFGLVDRMMNFPRLIYRAGSMIWYFMFPAASADTILSLSRATQRFRFLRRLFRVVLVARSPCMLPKRWPER